MLHEDPPKSSSIKRSKLKPSFRLKMPTAFLKIVYFYLPSNFQYIFMSAVFLNFLYDFKPNNFKQPHIPVFLSIRSVRIWCSVQCLEWPSIEDWWEKTPFSTEPDELCSLRVTLLSYLQIKADKQGRVGSHNALQQTTKPWYGQTHGEIINLSRFKMSSLYPSIRWKHTGYWSLCTLKVVLSYRLDY